MDFYKVLDNVEETVKSVIIQKNKTILKLNSQKKDLQKQLNETKEIYGIQNNLLKRRCREKDDLIHKRDEEIEILMIERAKMKKFLKTLKSNKSNDVSEENTFESVSKTEEETNAGCKEIRNDPGAIDEESLLKEYDPKGNASSLEESKGLGDISHELLDNGIDNQKSTQNPFENCKDAEVSPELDHIPNEHHEVLSKTSNCDQCNFKCRTNRRLLNHMKCHQQTKAIKEEGLDNQNGDVSKDSVVISNSDFEILSGGKKEPDDGYLANIVDKIGELDSENEEDLENTDNSNLQNRRLNVDQHQMLELVFESKQHIDAEENTNLANRVGISYEQVKKWFINRRWTENQNKEIKRADSDSVKPRENTAIEYKMVKENLVGDDFIVEKLPMYKNDKDRAIENTSDFDNIVEDALPMKEKETNGTVNDETVSKKQFEDETADEEIAEEDSGEPNVVDNGITNNITFNGEIVENSLVEGEIGEESTSDHRNLELTKGRSTFNSLQLSRLVEEFSKDHYLNLKGRKELASELDLGKMQVDNWFKNRLKKLPGIKENIKHLQNVDSSDHMVSMTQLEVKDKKHDSKSNIGIKRKRHVGEIDSPKFLPGEPGFEEPDNKKVKRMSKCGKCDECLRKDCDKCPPCLDKPRNNGTGRLRQKCHQKKCSNMSNR